MEDLSSTSSCRRRRRRPGHLQEDLGHLEVQGSLEPRWARSSRSFSKDVVCILSISASDGSSDATPPLASRSSRFTARRMMAAEDED